MKLLEGTEACPGSELPEVIQAIPSLKCVDGLGRTAFVYVASQHAARARESFRQNAGYSANELAELRQAFQNCDADCSGLISNSELVALVRSMFPVVNNRIKRRLGQLMQEVEQRAGEMDFPDFVRLIRQFHDLRVQEMVEKEKCAVADTQFSPEEVAGFRELFLESSTGFRGLALRAPASEKEVPLWSLVELVGNVCSANQSKEKTILGYAMDAKAKCEAGGAVVRRPDVGADASLAATVDFAEFLRVMRQILEANFGNAAGGRPSEASPR